MDNEELETFYASHPRRVEALLELAKRFPKISWENRHNLDYIGPQVSTIYEEFKQQNDEEMQSAALEVMLELNINNWLKLLHLQQARLDENITLAEYTKRLKARLVQAMSLGWTINNHHTISPPAHFLCAQKSWDAIYQCVLLEHAFVSVPHWFWNDNVLTTGDHT